MLRRSFPLLVLVLLTLSLAHAQNPLRLVTVTPCRLVDTRGNPIQGGNAESFNLSQLAQSGGFGGKCTPFNLSSAQAYSLNITLLPFHNQRVGYLTIWPTGEPQPTVSLMNSLDGRNKANAAIVGAGTNSAVSIYVSNTADVLIDINAYFDSASDNSALAFFPLTPCRVIDTRNGGNGGTLQGGVERDFSIPGSCGIPSDAQAYSFNVTALPPTNEYLGYVTVWPAGETRPSTSTLNDPTGTNVANAAIVPAGSEQKTAVYPSATTDLLIDVNGYFAPANSASNPLSLFTLTPCRIIDTRNSIGLFNGTLPVAVVGSQCGIPNVSQAFVLNATVVPPGPMHYLTLWPDGESQPTVSTLNAPDGAVTSNMAIVPAGSGTGAINAFAKDNTQLLLDISSYFAPIAPVSVETSSLPDAVQNAPYTAQLIAVSGVAPYTWTVTSGSLPPGMNPLGANGLITGTPNTIGTYPFTVKVTDSNNPASTATAHLSITVNGSAGTLTINTTSLPNGTVGTPYDALLAANGGYTPYSWSISSGSLPAGLSLNPSTGLISGTPSAAGLVEITVQVTDAQHNAKTQPLSVSVNTGDANGSLNGTYAVSFAGYDKGNWLVAAGSFTADGNGNITGGETDVDNSSSGVEFDQITSGNYSIGANGLGQISWSDNHQGSVQLLVATGADEDMQVIAFNQNGMQGTWGSGVIRRQNPSDFNFAALAGNYAFGFQGFNPTLQPLASDGSFQQDSQGNISNGNQDENNFGSYYTFTLTGNPTSSIDSFGRFTELTNRSDGFKFNHAEYIVSANENLYIGIDSGGSFYAGDHLRQSGYPFGLGTFNGNIVGRGNRIKSAASNPTPQAVVSLLSGNGNGTGTATVYTNTGGVVQGISGPFTYTVIADGKTVITLPDASQIVCYAVASNQAFCINTPNGNHDAAGAELTYGEPQSAGPFSKSSWSGEFLGGTIPVYWPAVFNQIDSIAVDGNGNFTSTYTTSGQGGTQQNQTLTATYTIDNTGYVEVSQGGTKLYLGYVVGPGKVVLISTDSNPRASVEVQSQISGPVQRH